MYLEPLKNKAQEDVLLKNRMIFAMLVVLLLVGVLLMRMYFLQVVRHEHFSTLSNSNRVKIVPVAPTRGLIKDRNGIILAQNQPSFSLELVPEAIDDIPATIEALKEVVSLNEEDIRRFNRLLKRKRRFESIPLRLHLSEDEVARFAVNRHQFEGVDIEARLNREYPLSKTFSHVVGYVGRINEKELNVIDETNYSATSHIGKVGVEKAFEGLLHGRVGYRHVETNARGRILRVLESEAPVPGYDLNLNLDTVLQQKAENALGDERGSIVAIDPRTGGVLAMVSTPGYDPNLFVNGIAQKDYKDLRDSLDRPLFNRSLRGQYPPGSTIKPFIGLAGLEYNTRLSHSHTYCKGWFQLPGKEHKYRDWKKTGHGKTDLNWALQRSCDVYFYELSLELGIDKIHDFLSRFGFGRRTGLDIGGEAVGLLPSREWKRNKRNKPWYPGETLITGIGQGFNLATPLQLAVATAALATRGNLIEPTVVSSLSVANTIVPMEPPGISKIKLLDSNWDEVIQGMVDVVNAPRGTARKISHDIQYVMAGKTGTAQVFGIGQEEKYKAKELEKRLHDHALFIAFAPVENPTIAVAVVVENGGGGSSTAAPIARKVIDAWLVNDRESELKEAK